MHHSNIAYNFEATIYYIKVWLMTCSIDFFTLKYV
jgi:hypothetical protein